MKKPKQYKGISISKEPLTVSVETLERQIAQLNITNQNLHELIAMKDETLSIVKQFLSVLGAQDASIKIHNANMEFFDGKIKISDIKPRT